MATDDLDRPVTTLTMARDAVFWTALAAGSCAGAMVLLAVAACEWNYVVAYATDRRRDGERS